MTEQERFDRCLGAVLRLEGGFVDSPRDRGGPTNLGITAATLSEVLGRPATQDDIRALTPDAVRPIYRERYWIVSGCDLLRPGLDLMVFDAAVNMGAATAVRMLQGAVAVSADGVAGPLTLAAAAKADPLELIGDLCSAREARYRALADFDVFGAGWLTRLATVRTLALSWIDPGAGKAPPTP